MRVRVIRYLMSVDGLIDIASFRVNVADMRYGWKYVIL